MSAPDGSPFPLALTLALTTVGEFLETDTGKHYRSVFCTLYRIARYLYHAHAPRARRAVQCSSQQVRYAISWVSARLSHLTNRRSPIATSLLGQAESALGPTGTAIANELNNVKNAIITP